MFKIKIGAMHMLKNWSKKLTKSVETTEFELKMSYSETKKTTFRRRYIE